MYDMFTFNKTEEQILNKDDEKMKHQFSIQIKTSSFMAQRVKTGALKAIKRNQNHHLCLYLPKPSAVCRRGQPKPTDGCFKPLTEINQSTVSSARAQDGPK